MRSFLTCPQGHQWSAGEETWPETAQPGHCPVCREAGSRPTPAPDGAETQALPTPVGDNGVPADPPGPAGEVTTDGPPTCSTPSTVVVPGYEILKLLGRGGMGVVYEAREVKLNRIVAVKMLKGGIHAGDSDRARFRTEAEAIARLQHPNVVQIHDIGEAGGCPYLSLEFCAGGTLATRLAGKPLPASKSAGLAETLGRALHYCHQRGILHRDLKPANVLLTLPEGAGDSWGEPKITDFGLAKQLEGDTGPTQTGGMKVEPLCSGFGYSWMRTGSWAPKSATIRSLTFA